jgi:hypothetical protein
MPPQFRAPGWSAWWVFARGAFPASIFGIRLSVRRDSEERGAAIDID